MLGVQFFLFVLLLELLVLFAMLISLIIERFSILFIKKIRKDKNKLLEEFFRKALSETHPEKKHLPKTLQNPWFLAEGLFKIKLEDDRKKTSLLAESIAERYLIAFARKNSRSIFHNKKLLSARIFTLYSSGKDAPYLRRLLDDKNLLIVAGAAEAAIRLNNQESVDKTLKKMSTLPSYIYNMLLDVFLAAGRNIHTTLEKILKNKPPTLAAIAAIDILSKLHIKIPKDILKDAMKSNIIHLTEGALKAHIACPQQESEKVFVDMLDAKSPSLRQLAALGLASFPSSSNAHKLEAMLCDPVWQVRVEAASSLHQMGTTGANILLKASKCRNEKSKSSALFILKVTKEMSL